MSDNGSTLSVDDGGSTLSIDDGSGSITVDGSVTVSGTVTADTELPAAAALADNTANPTAPAVAGFPHWYDGATWDRAKGDSTDGLLVNLGANNDVTVTSGTITTITNVVHVDDNSSTLSVDDGGSSLTVDGTVAATQSGTWNVTNVSGTVSLPTGAATLAEQQSQTTSLQLIDNLVLAEDAAHQSGDPGVQVLAKRSASPANTSTTDGDYEPLQVSAGRLWASATIDAALPAGTNAIGKLAANDGVDVGDVTINNAAGGSAVNIQDGGNSITVDGTVAVSGTVTVDTELSTAAALADNTANPTVTSVGTFPHWYDGSTWDRAKGDSTDGLLVNLGANNDVTVTGTVTAQQSTASSLKAQVQVIDGAGDSCMDGTNDALRVNVVAGGAGDGAILDGVSSSIKATVLDYTNSNPLAVRLTDTNGDYVAAGAGTQYTEDAAAPGDPVGTAVALVRKDTPATIATTDGDIVAQRGTNYGAAYVQVVSSAGAFVDTFGGGTQYTEDAASAADPVGNALILRRRDSLASEVTTDGDNVAANATSKGELYVKHVDAIPVTDNSSSLTVDNAGTFAVQAAQSGTWNVTNVSGTVSLPTGASTLAEQQSQTTSLQLIDDVIVADDAGFTPATTKVAMVGFTFDDVAPDSVNEGDAGAARMSANRNIYTTIRDAAGNERGVNVNASNQLSVSVDNTVTVGSHAVTNAGTFVVQENGAALTALQLIDDPVATLGTTTYSEATTKGMIIGAVRRDADTTLVDTTNEISPLQVDANGRLKVEAFSGETLPVSLTSTTITGTVAVTQSGTWDEVGINDSGNSITVDNGGTFVVQENGAALTSLQLIDDVVFTDDNAFTAATSKVLAVGAKFDAAATDSVDEDDIGILRMSANRNLFMNIRDAAGNERGANVNASNQLSVSVDNTVTVGSHAVTNAGTFAVQVDGSALTALQKIDDPVLVDDAAFTPATSSVMMAGFEYDDTGTDSVDEGDAGAARMSANRNIYMQIRDAAGNERGAAVNASNQLSVTGPVTNAGTFVVQENGAALTSLQLIDDAVFTDDAAFTPATSKVLGIGLQADETATDSVDEGDIGAPRMTLDRKVIVTTQPHTAGGLSIFRSLDLDESEEDVKTSAGCVYGMWVTNTATSTRWIKFYNATAANVTVGSTTPVITWGIPGNSSDDISGLFAGANGIMFDTAISVAATTGVADADTGAPGANEVIINVFYK